MKNFIKESEELIKNYIKKKFIQDIIMIYDFITISLLLVVAYCGSYTLYQKNFIKRTVHLRLWNILILLTFLVSAGAGLTLLSLIEYGLALPVSQSFLYWHVEFGITMFWIALFHMHSYWKPSKGKNSQNPSKIKEKGEN